MVDASGKLLEDIGHVAQIQKIPDVLASCSIAVAPGEYRLRLDRADRPALERALIAVAGWQTQIFLLQRDDGTVRRPDLEGGSVVMSNRGHFAPEDELTRLSELARYALTQHHKILSEDLRQVLRGKFEDPMLGLFGAHLIIRDMPQDEEILENVFVNLEMLLGNNHPDVMALSLRRKLPQAPTIREFHQPPMLRASWDLIVEASFASPSLISIGSPVERIGGQVLPTSSWLTWRTTTAAMGVAEEPVGRQPVLAALADYMRARVVANFPDGTSRAVEAVEQPATSLSELDQASKAELARSFGVPRLALEGMLDKLPK